jgi:hypothetical protein
MAAPRRELDTSRIAKLPPLDSIAPQTYPISHVRVLEKDSEGASPDWSEHNKNVTKITEHIHSGGRAKGAARMVEMENKGKKADVVKIDSSK